MIFTGPAWFALLIALSVFADLSCPSKPEPQDFSRDIEIMLETLRTESPELFERINSGDRRDLLKRVMAVLNSGVIPEENVEYGPESGSGLVQNTVHPSIMLAEDTVCYIRLDVLNKQSLAQFVADLSKIKTQKVKVRGILLDIRCAASADYDIVKDFSSALQALREDKTVLASAPVAVLYGKRTSGAPELLAAVIGSMPLGITMGEKSAGCHFPGKTVSLPSGQWYIPVPSKEMLSEFSVILKPPAFEFEPYPQYPLEKLEKDSLPAKDKAVRKAVEIIQDLYLFRSTIRR